MAGIPLELQVPWAARHRALVSCPCPWSPPLSGWGACQRTSSKTRSDPHEFLKLPVIAFLNLWSPTPMPMPLFNSLCSIRFFFLSFDYTTKFNSYAPASVNLARPTKPTVTAPATAPATVPATALPASLTNQSYHLQPCPIYLYQSYPPRPPYQSRALIKSWPTWETPRSTILCSIRPPRPLGGRLPSWTVSASRPRSLCQFHQPPRRQYQDRQNWLSISEKSGF